MKQNRYETTNNTFLKINWKTKQCGCECKCGEPENQSKQEKPDNVNKLTSGEESPLNMPAFILPAASSSTTKNQSRTKQKPPGMEFEAYQMMR